MLALDNVTLHRGRTRVLDGVSLVVDEGELVALIGANGAGKTTVLRTISGILAPSAGTIAFRGKPIQGADPDAIVRLGIAHCPEERKIWPQMSVQEHLELGAFIRSDRDVDADMARVFDTFPVLKERREQLAGTLSGGQQQMLAIGRALMSRPSLVLFDEPSLGLAPIMVETIGTMIADIRERGTTVLLVEQNASLALRLADRAYVLETGRITLTGPAAALIENPDVHRAYLGG
ncbi:MAG TPA: ABC transporter ATP-binding protein [Casimicrobiaceae bacterium]|jgi:branched-chain amino acid transport system ATP-binding protein|nr:ABC transporter ATP-binding protein [Casimicrobiaceae bacterium]HET9750521.1 ABC transporter ATP-binding protein [Casimicrobiaceae bacterium]